MRPAPFSYARPATLAAALKELQAGGRILAGGQSLIPLMKRRAATPERVVDIGALDELRGIREAGDGAIGIGALTRHRDIVDSDLLQRRLPWLVKAVRLIGDVQVRNRGTVGGSVCISDTASNLAPVLISLRAQAVIAGGKGERRAPVEEIFAGALKNSLGPGELLTALLIPPPGPGARGDYLEVATQAHGIRLVNVGVTVRGDPVQSVGVGIGGLSAIPVRARRVEAALVGRALADAAGAVRELAKEGFELKSDQDAPGAYRLQVAQVLITRALSAGS